MQDGRVPVAPLDSLLEEPAVREGRLEVSGPRQEILEGPSLQRAILP